VRVLGAEIHDQIVRMLIVDQRPPLKVSPCLEDLRRADVLQRERPSNENIPMIWTRDPPLNIFDSRSHQPVLRFDFIEVGELAQLVVVAGEHVSLTPHCQRWRTDVECGGILCASWSDGCQQDQQERRRGASPDDYASLKRREHERCVIVVLTRAR
jgi:hypothetical protein